ncbi:Ubiquitin-conjugating enzyme E2 1 [Mucor velutinosus]|uniref:Ubiquitin-conjugating enzyme E2 1 n=1 Tax=Mucor velutinosus TaxID=708070 RepID=A0AAN7D4C7_9FUNG|nr:Ubiquitin-conjugating enzyme E2 1 [Mucor velutinosus]
MNSSNFNYKTSSNQLHFGTPLSSTADLQLDVDSDDADSRPGKRSGRRKIEIEYIEDKSRRHITFSKRKAGIMKKAYELSTLTGTQVLLLVVSETGLVYTFTTPKLQPLVTRPEGKSLIQECLNAPDLSHLSMANAAAQAHAHAMQQQQQQQQQQMNTMAAVTTNPSLPSSNASIGYSTLFPYPSQRSNEIYTQLDGKPSFTSNHSPLYPSPYHCNDQQQQQQQQHLPGTYPPTLQECVGNNNSINE